MPAGARWLFWLTWLLLGLAVFMLAALLSMWRHRQGTWARRLYYLVLTGAARGVCRCWRRPDFWACRCGDRPAGRRCVERVHLNCGGHDLAWAGRRAHG
ncbi:MAG: hypothetical protein R2838_02240 [Caldilineaceae bacterium]